ncbi:Glycosyltransferase involved in cell wall bisynthesis [Fontibacillus panacisegetis]|uniref:Glycosyltransferase involved in cell wall bisynthesis n=1 Tax=Fontibacillus panacisegetis TaxID=670482 RepID=A0A1G7KDH4_9BACL|nr:glycosyltransferase family 4 protein [Fontibacillus panacisegetis]SDF35253.1 Glycosyltransferase involved in cell wall bisynthesis [Fontibacillus panacisegetis]
MNILLASFFELPQIGGLWTYMFQLKRSLEQLGHTVDIFARSVNTQNYKLINREAEIDKESLHRIIEPHVLRELSYSSPQTPLWILNQEVERYKYEAAAVSFNLQNYDVIHAQDIISTYCFSRIKPKNIPLIATIHASLAFEWKHTTSFFSEKNPAFHRYALLLEFLGASSSDKTIVPSYWLKNYLMHNFHVPSEKLVVIPNGIDIPHYFEQMLHVKKMDRSPHKIIFACVARLTFEKGISYLLNALAQLNTIRQDWDLWLIGDGPLKGELQEQCKQLNIFNQVQFLGFRNDVPVLLQQADIFLLSSIQETFCYSILEAQLAEVPVIAPRTGGITELVTHRKTGLLFESENSEDLLANIKLLLSNKKLQRAIIEQAKQTAATKFSSSLTTKKIVDIYYLCQMLSPET